MTTPLDSLEVTFKEAKEQNKKYIAVMVAMPNCPKNELIINERENFDSKLNYYKKAYDDQLHLKTFNAIQITGFVYGDTLAEIENQIIS
jgi:hypothetical protein